MKRHIPGLHSTQQASESPIEGVFLARVDWASYRWYPQKPFLNLQFVVLQPSSAENRLFSGRLYSTPRALWKLNWFLRDFGYDRELLTQDEVDEKALLNLRGIVRTSYVSLAGRIFQNLEAFAPSSEWEELRVGDSSVGANGNGHGL